MKQSIKDKTYMEPGDINTKNKFFENPAVFTAMKCAAIGAALVATAASGGVTVATATTIAGIAVGAAIVAPAAHALEESSFAKEKPVLQKACKFVRVACETSLAIGAGLVYSPHFLIGSAACFVTAKTVQKIAEYKISNNNDGDNNRYTMAKNFASGIASACVPLTLGSAFPGASELGNIYSPTFEGGKNVFARTGSALFAASTAAFSGACYVSSASLDNAGFKKAASATRVIGHVALAATAVLASVTAGFAVGEEIYSLAYDSPAAAVAGLVTGVGVGASIAGIAAAAGVLVADTYCKDTVTKDMSNAIEIFTTKGKTDTIVVNKTPPTKEIDAAKTTGASNIPSGSPRRPTMVNLTRCIETTSGNFR